MEQHVRVALPRNIFSWPKNNDIFDYHIKYIVSKGGKGASVCTCARGVSALTFPPISTNPRTRNVSRTNTPAFDAIWFVSFSRSLLIRKKGACVPGIRRMHVTCNIARIKRVAREYSFANPFQLQSLDSVLFDTKYHRTGKKKKTTRIVSRETFFSTQCFFPENKNIVIAGVAFEKLSVYITHKKNI